eukprot:TRINITY_DN13640_c0_g1_i1.p1 TRINITY_DN13640_c0_g1~~TRINITY_DN13640_c0_g1_i1.p1  ORF type:complete len:134 (-),score=8.56 TRINITY_DN13640_c0_g1_i1:41-415(-)
MTAAGLTSIPTTQEEAIALAMIAVYNVINETLPFAKLMNMAEGETVPLIQVSETQEYLVKHKVDNSGPLPGKVFKWMRKVHIRNPGTVVALSRPDQGGRSQIMDENLFYDVCWMAHGVDKVLKA